jgi:hypothetical protein
LENMLWAKQQFSRVTALEVCQFFSLFKGLLLNVYFDFLNVCSYMHFFLPYSLWVSFIILYSYFFRLLFFLFILFIGLFFLFIYIYFKIINFPLSNTLAVIYSISIHSSKIFSNISYDFFFGLLLRKLSAFSKIFESF